MATSLSSSWSLVTPLLLLLSSLFLAQATCYEPSGLILQDDTACDPTADASYCCGTGWSCLSDGICLIKQQDSTFYYRGTCTDKSWSSQSCPSFCLQFGTNASLPMGKCNRSDGQDWYCCEGDDNCDCNTGRNAVKLGGSQPSTVTVIGSTSWPGKGSTKTASNPTTTATAGASSTGKAAASSKASFASGTPTKKPSSPGSASTSSATATQAQSSSHVAVTAGVSAGVGGVAAIGIVGALFYLLRRRPSRDRSDIKSVEHHATGPYAEKVHATALYSEADGRAAIYEAPSSPSGQNGTSYNAQRDKNHAHHVQGSHGLAPVELDASTYEASEMDGLSTYSRAPLSGVSPLASQAGLVHRLA